jgi:hypothetical protein
MGQHSISGMFVCGAGGVKGASMRGGKQGVIGGKKCRLGNVYYDAYCLILGIKVR